MYTYRRVHERPAMIYSQHMDPIIMIMIIILVKERIFSTRFQFHIVYVVLQSGFKAAVYYNFHTELDKTYKSGGIKSETQSHLFNILGSSKLEHTHAHTG